MAQVKKQVELNNFSGGFNTEQSPLNADPSTTLQEQNMILASDGSRARRYGLSAEPATAAVLLTAALSGGDPLELSTDSIHGITSPGTDGVAVGVSEHNYSIMGNYDYFRILRHDETRINSSVVGPALNVTSGGTQTRTGTASGGNYIFPKGLGVTVISPQAIGSLGDLIVTASSRVYIRDLFGVEETGIEISDRPSTLTEDHAYNLLNQGWTPKSIAKFFSEIGDYPSNGDVSYFGLLPDTNSTAVPPPNIYDQETLKDIPFPEGAPKGNLYLDIHQPNGVRDISVFDSFAELNTLLGTTLLRSNITDSTSTTATSNYALTSAASFLGRVFYSGRLYSEDNYAAKSSGGLAPSFKNAVFFSRVLDSYSESVSDDDILRKKVPDKSNPFRCMSALNPTKSGFSPAVTDGGFFFIAGAQSLHSVHATRQSLIVVGSNGVWEVIPQDGLSPSTFTITKILDVDIHSSRGVIEAEDTILVPTSAGIYALQYDGNSRRTVASNISDASVRSFLLPRRKWIKDGVYDTELREVRWLLSPYAGDYPADSLQTIPQEELVLDLKLGSYSVNTFPSVTVKALHSATVLYPDNPFDQATWAGGVGTDDTNYFFSAYVSMGVSYEIEEVSGPISSKRGVIKTKIAGALPSAVAVRFFAKDDMAFQDTGTSYTSYMVTNPLTMGDTIRNKDLPYVWTHFYRSEDGFEDDGSGDWVPTNPSGCLLSARWDFSDSAQSGKWTTPRQVYRYQRDYMPEDINDPFDYGQSIITTKNNVPGTGKALSLKFESDGDKDLQLIGWGAEVAINGGV